MSLQLPYLRDGIDVYVRGEDEVHFVFLASRKRIVTKAKPFLIQALAWLDGKSSSDSLADRVAGAYGSLARDQFVEFLAYLERHGIVVEPDWLKRTELDPEIAVVQQRQMAFLLDVLGTPKQAELVQRKILNARLVLFGLGAVGSWILRQLLAMGFREFVLIDHDVTEPTDVSRHALYASQDAATSVLKAEAAANKIREHFKGVEVSFISAALTPESELEDLIPRGTDLVINAADQPYIGFTSVLLSRYCVPRRIPLLVAGGFDAHLGSVSEMIVPGVTPCADCYADYFREALSDWKPIEHPVEDRREGPGGLCSLSVFAAGAAVMEILRLFMGQAPSESGRGELLFENYQLDRFTVERRPDCPVCARA